MRSYEKKAIFVYLCTNEITMIPSSPYKSTDRLRDLIADNSLLLMAMSRFEIPLRLANKSVEEACREAGRDTATFLCVANMISRKPYDAHNINLSTLTDYLKKAHTYFLDFFLPSIRRKLIEAIDFAREHDVALIIFRFYDQYVEEVRRHMDYENETLFGYIDSLIAERPIEGYNISVFAAHHDAISLQLKRLKDVLIQYSPDGNADMINSALFSIISCEADLICHCEVEDKILIPAVLKAEEALSNAPTVTAEIKEEAAPTPSSLGKREKEIIVCIARGMSNKEIADQLCISVHTVATHRRNICSKLEIHSPAGLTIYAILNGLIDPKEVVV